MGAHSSKNVPDSALVHNDLTLAINGKKVVVKSSDVDPSARLLDFLRINQGVTGVKEGCGEGGCGACAVVLSRTLPDGKVIDLNTNACLRPLAACDGWAITTTEGLGGSKHANGYHPIQERISAFHGTQCGFCTPGMVMATYGALKRLGKNASMAELENAIDGNICRCTGFRPILDAAKSFASDHKVEDHVSHEAELGPYDTQKYDPAFPGFLKKYKPQALHFSGSGYEYLRPVSLQQVFDILGYLKPNSYRFVQGNTSSGIYKQQKERVVIDLSQVPELHTRKVADDGITIGAGVSITDLSALLKESETKNAAASHLNAHIAKVASFNVRNIGSVVGNLCMAKKYGFLSDIATLMSGVGAVVTTSNGKQTSSIPVAKFIKSPNLAQGHIVVSLTVPFIAASDVFRTYRAALRPNNAHAYINAAFHVSVTDGKFTKANLVFGGVKRDDSPNSHAVVAQKTAESLVGQPASAETYKAAAAALREEVKSDPANHRAEYRDGLISSFFYKFFLELVPSVPAKLASTSTTLVKDTSSGLQEFKFSDEHAPVSKPVRKIESRNQTSGEAKFTDDIAIRPGTVFGAYVSSTQARAKVKNIDWSAALAAEGVVDYVTAKDIKGANNCSALGQQQEFFVSGDEVKWHGAPLGLILADSRVHAEQAARLVKVQYDTEGKAPVLTIEEAKEQKDFVTGLANEFKVGDGASDESLKGNKHHVEGSVYVDTQLHFYMEPQVAYVIPEEGNRYVVYAPVQWPDAVHTAAAAALGVPVNHVQLISRRCGGGFGGKLTHIIQHVAAAAVAAQKLNKPVRLLLNRNIDCQMHGGREETLSDYQAAFDDTGRISACRMEGVANAGWLVDLSWFKTMAFPSAFNQCYNFENLLSKCTLVCSNLSNRTPVRGPGEIEGSWTVETIIEHVAHQLGIPSHVVRERNFYNLEKTKEGTVPNGKTFTQYTIPEMWARVKAKSNFETRLKEVQAFNTANRWKKRGIAMSPVRYEVAVWPKNALVNIYADGSVVVHIGGCEMGQGLNTKVAQAVAYQLSQLFGDNVTDAVPVDMIAFADNNTFVTPNAAFTGGSTGSEGSAEAARRAAATICERLKPVLEDLRNKAAESEEKKDEAAEIAWKDLIAAAKGASINLSAQDHWSGAGDDTLAYQNWGVACSEIMLDVLTGETDIVSTDIMYDCGKSLNPAIDIGQAEGAFMMGVGYYLREQVVMDKTNGRMVSNGTWEYKPPMYRDIPTRMTVEFLQKGFDKGILSSKASGEPPLVLATSVALAVRQAVTSARADAGLKDFFKLDAPMTVDVIRKACGVTTDQLAL